MKTFHVVTPGGRDYEVRAETPRDVAHAHIFGVDFEDAAGNTVASFAWMSIVGWYAEEEAPAPVEAPKPLAYSPEIHPAWEEMRQNRELRYSAGDPVAPLHWPQIA